ncbi:MAG: hypothetical protein JXB62_20860 [Pirellulales bacterium]|nr:hypothetical protein [Pirellulales bacterium]
MIEVACWNRVPSAVRYTAIDLFEARTAVDGPGVSIKKAHRLLSATGARIRLVPGDPFIGLAEAANTLGQVDLIVVSSRLDPRALARAWFYVPRLLHLRSQVFLETSKPAGRQSIRLLDRSEINDLVIAATVRKAA